MLILKEIFGLKEKEFKKEKVNIVNDKKIIGFD
jgi:hypothetical protein